MPETSIIVKNARQNNLKGIDLRLPLNRLIVITGVSGSGKSSLAFDTLYAEGQRRYVETFSPYTRQFLDRMDKPRVDRIEGIPPAIAIDQVNPVRTSRSTVGTMSELNDYIKLLFARAAQLYCGGCGRRVRRDTPESIADDILSFLSKEKKRLIAVTFPVPIPHNFTEEEVKAALLTQGYERFFGKKDEVLEVIQDRLVLSDGVRSRIVDDLTAALRNGRGLVTIRLFDSERRVLSTHNYSADLHCPDCKIHFEDPVPGAFSFNSPIGACTACHGFGRIIDIDESLVVPDPSKTLKGGAVKPWQTKTYGVCQTELEHFAKKRKIPLSVPWRDLTMRQRQWVFEGEGEFDDGVWYGVRRFFRWLESKSYKMHIRVLLSKYRMYRKCPGCGGTRLKMESLLWRLGGGPGKGKSIHEVMLLPIDKCRAFFLGLKEAGDPENRPSGEAYGMLLDEILCRLGYLVDVGLGYLSLDRQSRTLSGGEVQRINLTTALGTSLVNTLFILDEPSIGLHSRDIGRLVSVLHRLRDAGNTLIVVEHDPEVIRCADVVVDMGPGPGERGGGIVYCGDVAGLLQSPVSKTGAYLRKSGQRPISSGGNDSPAEGPCIEIIGACAHNLKDIDVLIPLNRFVCVTGVSGSGKSTLIQDVCYNALCRIKAHPADRPGEHREIRGHRLIDDVVMVDQSPIGKTTRSNPASYVGALDAIRKIFSATDHARREGYGPGAFSFNSKAGQCPACRGSGFEHIEMQFLSDVYLRCIECDGRRYRREILEVKLKEPSRGDMNMSIADVLELTVDEAYEVFGENEDVLRALKPLRDVGLGYLALGQSVPTLSGGEAQRLKIAGYLARTAGRKKTAKHLLFLLDEPTTGLHGEDIEKLLASLRFLCEAGNSVVVIEHNLQVIGSADWIIDLGPEGGEDGGEVVCTGHPHTVAGCKRSYTGKALRTVFAGRDGGKPAFSDASLCGKTEKAGPAGGNGKKIHIRHARENNLRNIDVSIPHDRLTVITGVSGSGKSTLAFDILFSEGQRRYCESLNAYIRQYVRPAKRPDVDLVSGIPPAVAIEQRTSRGGGKSTVATMTEVYHFLRLLFARGGTQYCPDCGVRVGSQTISGVRKRVTDDFEGKEVVVYAPLVASRKGYYTDLAAWASSEGYPYLRVDGTLVSTSPWPRLDRFREHTIDLPVAEVTVTRKRARELMGLIEKALGIGKGVIYIAQTGKPGKGAEKQAEAVFSTRRVCPRCDRSFREPDPRLFSFNSGHGACPACDGTGIKISTSDKKSGRRASRSKNMHEYGNETETVPCSVCRGGRLREEALHVKFKGRTITSITALSIEAAAVFFSGLDLSGREAEITRDICAEISVRLDFLREVGLPYLSLDRPAPTLSSGEAQRIRLAAQLGSNLRGVCYILDEPTIGLHARDNRHLMRTLLGLREKGNTVVVVEHDDQTIRDADHIIDLGPGGGINGGRLVFEGTPEALLSCRESLTGEYLRSPEKRYSGRKKRSVGTEEDRGWLRIGNVNLHNLKNLDVAIPLGRLVCVTGVSGSGKSTLVRDILYRNLSSLLQMRRPRGKGKSGETASGFPAGRAVLSGCGSISGWEKIGRVLEVDQTPIGRTPRSCPATYVGFWADIRRLFAGTTDSRVRGYGPERFSFNVEGGRCESCKGQGVRKIEMSFLPDVEVLCETCNGTRFTHETREVRYRDKSIADVLAMDAGEAAAFFSAHQSIRHALSLISEVGLGYLSLGQRSPSLSGGEAQRIKLVSELVKAGPQEKHPDPRNKEKLRNEKHTLYILDEPTIGLHMADVSKLVGVLHRLTDCGNTVVIIEHNLDVIAEADWIIDLGPEGGEGGGRIVAQGQPEKVALKKKDSHTARFLAGLLERENRW
ncbi:MAG: excinuclease ABC subunit UvrA [Spirochaetales bacterium]|nr:excinuclease ABC subunit UvrA [Spirochaetales bacterium]